MGTCPECGLPIQATLLSLVDPRAAEIQPIRSRRTVATGLAAWAVASYIAAPTSRWLLQAIALIVGGVLFVLAFVVASRLLRIGEVTEVLTRLTSRITGRLGARSAR